MFMFLFFISHILSTPILESSLLDQHDFTPYSKHEMRFRVTDHLHSSDTSMIFLSLLSNYSWLNLTFGQPKLVGMYDDGDSQCRRLKRYGNIMYAAWQGHGVRFFNATNSTRLEYLDKRGVTAFDVDIGHGEKDYLISGESGGFSYFEIFPNDMPNHVEFIPTGGNVRGVNARDMKDVVFLGSWNYDFIAYDVSNSSNLNELGRYTSPDASEPFNSVCFEEAEYCITTESGDGGALVVFNISDFNITDLNTFDSGFGSARDIAYDPHTKTVFVSDSASFQSIDVSDPLSISRRIALPFESSGVEVEHPYVFVGAKQFGMVIFDVSNPDDPKLYYNYTTENGFHVYPWRNMIYFCDYNSGIYIFEWEDVEVKGDVPGLCGNVTISMEARDGSGKLEVHYDLIIGDHVCGEFGQCDGDSNLCVCKDGNYTGDYCQNWKCQGVDRTSIHVCGGNGICLSHDFCKCNESYFGANCTVGKCYGILGTNESVCSGNGKCLADGSCRCDIGYHGKECNVTICDGIFTNDTTGRICGGKGVCTSYNNCTCFDSVLSPVLPYCSCPSQFHGKFCNITECGDYLSNDTERVCSGHGICNISQVCTCTNGNYTGPYCNIWYCNNIDRNNKLAVCNGLGTCIDYNNCSCSSSEAFGEFCQNWYCHGVINTNYHSVCGGHGTCKSPNQCFCNIGYNSWEVDGICTNWMCGKKMKNESGVCSGRGTCIDVQNCQCNDDYEGYECQTWSCGFDQSHKQTCSGNGECLSPNECDCEAGFAGDNCETNMLYYYVMAPVLSVSAIFAFVVVLIIFACLICCACCIFVVIILISVFALGSICCCLVCVICCSSCIFFFLMIYLVVFKFRLKKFGKLKNVDLLITEQELEDETSLANITIKKELFEIDMDEIKVEKIIGEGGSQSTVFLADWRGKRVAFKCFRTRSLCSSQENFDEFEREVEVMGSVAHPNILRFFGCAIKPPRVGIVMEFCSNGDLLRFIYDYRQEHDGKQYPFHSKYRMLEEVISAMGFLHLRSIIHRDIKLENILVNKEETVKLMDFGLSRHMERMSQNKTTRVGTSVYMAPEQATTEKYNEKADVYSFGILIWIFITEIFQPYGPEERSVELIVANNPNFRPDINLLRSWCPRGYGWITDVVEICWTHEPKKRKSFDDLAKLFASKRIKKGSGEEKYDKKEEEKEKQEDEDLKSFLESKDESEKESSSSGEEKNEEKESSEEESEEKEKEEEEDSSSSEDEDSKMKSEMKRLEERNRELEEKQEVMESKIKKLKKKIKKLKKKRDDDDDE